jgi:hypothetical protein
VKPLSYPVPWDLVLGLTPYIARRARRHVGDFSRDIVARMHPPPVVEGLGRLPESPRFVLVANHYQRKGLWILHPAAAITQAVLARYGELDPPVRWVVTANWPPLRLGPWKLPSPGDWLLPRVAEALGCYPVAFAGADPALTARALRRLLRDARTLERPIGLFPEGVAGAAGRLAAPLPGTGRLIGRLAAAGLPAVPCGIAERGGALRIVFGDPLPVSALLSAPDAARLALGAVASLLAGPGLDPHPR